MVRGRPSFHLVGRLVEWPINQTGKVLLTVGGQRGIVEDRPIQSIPAPYQERLGAGAQAAVPVVGLARTIDRAVDPRQISSNVAVKCRSTAGASTIRRPRISLRRS